MYYIPYKKLYLRKNWMNLIDFHILQNNPIKCSTWRYNNIVSIPCEIRTSNQTHSKVNLEIINFRMSQKRKRNHYHAEIDSQCFQPLSSLFTRFCAGRIFLQTRIMKILSFARVSRKKKKKILYLDAMKTKVSDRRKTVNEQQVSWRHDAFA